MVKILGHGNSIINQFLYEIRDENVQKDSLRFRRNMERLGEIFAYEISKELNFEVQQVQTPLGIASVPVLSDKIVVSSVMRAGLPLHQGILNIFDKAENAFISAYRQYEKDGTFEIQFGYLSSPGIDEKVVILADPMIATGASMIIACQSLLEKGNPRHVHIVALIASREGLQYVQKRLDMQHTTIWLGAVDDELTVKAFIVPGLGDAGDLAFGAKE
ncbi:MAG: uracil phosphoribosyltransferase [Bacteroidia bacterium]|nr:uracil phosphoribosyltransferase [Bacteroidia bacterium]